MENNTVAALERAFAVAEKPVKEMLHHFFKFERVAKSWDEREPDNITHIPPGVGELIYEQGERYIIKLSIAESNNSSATFKKLSSKSEKGAKSMAAIVNLFVASCRTVLDILKKKYPELEKITLEFDPTTLTIAFKNDKTEINTKYRICIAITQES